MTHDEYLEHQVELHNTELEMNEEVSECCCAEVDELIDYDECTKCKSPCRTITRGEYETSEYERSRDDY